jgi:membrane fusion protein (multidrug efflux system)
VRVRLARTEVERIDRAAGESAVSPIEIDRKRSELDLMVAEQGRWQAELEEAEAKVKQVEARLAKFTIASAFRARAGIRTVHEGQFLAEGTRVVLLEEIGDRIFLDFAIPQEYLDRVKVGSSVRATSAMLGPDPVEIEVVAIDATVNNTTRNIRVRAAVDNRDGRLRPGMFIPIRVPVSSAQPVVVVPSSAVRRASYADQVFVLVPGEKPEELRAKQRFVKIGPSIGDELIVLEGLSAGERIAAGGSFKLRDGALVTVAPPGPAKLAPPAAAAPPVEPDERAAR